MTKINLLPWRERRRDEKKQQFFLLLGVSAVATVFFLALIHLTISARVNHQRGDNGYLQEEVATLDNGLTEIGKLQREKEQLVTRMKVIHQLQLERPEVVHLFDEMVRVMPEGVYLTSMMRQGNQITLHGQAESSTLVSKLMRNIEASDWLTKPNLLEIKNDPQQSPFSSVFILLLELKTPTEDSVTPTTTT